MIKEPRNRDLTREDVYAEYFSRLADQEHRCVDSVFYDRMKEVNGIFKGKTQLELMIKGTYKKLFTFINKTYNIGTGTEGLEQCLRDLDFFQVFMSGDPINYFSEIENEYINYTRVLNAHIFMELT